MIFKKKKYHTKTLVGIRNELSIFLMRGDEHLAMLTAVNGNLRIDYDFEPPILEAFFSRAYLKKYGEAWDYIYNVATIQAQNGGSELERFDINVEDFFRGGKEE